MFTHLHVHSHFSILESSARIEELAERAALLGMDALALTDKYAMGGAVQFYRLAKAAGLKPITGCEICLSDNDLSHLTLLVKNKTGYENLCRLVSKSHTETGYFHEGGLPRIPAVKIGWLAEFCCGLIALSGCSNGKISRLLKENNIQEAMSFAKKLFNIFGRDFYIEIQRCKSRLNLHQNNGLASEALAAFSQKTKIPAAATNNVHYLLQEDCRTYSYLAKIKAMGTKADPLFNIIQGGENYLKSPQEMAALFKDMPSAIKNTQIIADKCCFDFELGKTVLPVFKTPYGQPQEKYLSELCMEGIKARFGAICPQKVTERLEKELDIIHKTGFAGYFLIVADIAEFAHKNSIPICGKGSSAGSLVSYLLKISNVDPVENNLYFERFLNEERAEPPDIDIDISAKDRQKIWYYLCRRYGNSSIARVSSFATTKPRAAIRESGRITGMAKEDVDYIIKSAPGYNRFYTPKKMQNSLKSAGLADIKDPSLRKILSLSENIGGYIRHVSMHPSAFIVSDCDLSCRIPLTLSETGEIMSQYDMNSIDDIGILKIDLINSLSLSLISDVSAILEKQRKIKIDMADIPCNDSNIFDLMQKGSTLGVFQLESFGIRTLSRKIKPACLNDITLLISLYRPGPQQSGMVNNFIERKFGREKISYIHKDLEPLLKETFGVILYQEQAMQAAIKIAGYSLSEADGLRKAMVNLSHEKMLSQQQRFMQGGLKKGYSAAIVGYAFRLISKFASYGFVKAHAAAYADISCKTCFLKYHYPAEFLATILTNNSGYFSKMQYLEEARRLGIALKLPDINKSGFEFKVENCGKTIRVPLISVKNLGYAGTNCIINERNKNGAFRNFDDFYSRVSANCRISCAAIENLIKTGAFNFTGTPAKQLLHEFYSIKKLKKPPANTAGAIFDCRDFSCYIKKTDKAMGLEKDFSIEEKLLIEAQLLGFYISAHPLQVFKQGLKNSGACPAIITKSGSFYNLSGPVTAAGIIISKRIENTKSGQNMMFCTMEDEDGMYEAVFFSPVYKKYIKLLSSERFIIIKGRLHIKDNNVSLIAKEVLGIAAFSKNERIRKKEAIKESFLAGVANPWIQA